MACRRIDRWSRHRKQFVTPSISFFSLTNASGLTAADLASAQGFHDCFHFLSSAQKRFPQIAGLCANGAPCGQGSVNRKRLLADVETDPTKKARRSDGADISMQIGGGGEEELEGVNVESEHSDNDITAVSNGRAEPMKNPSARDSPSSPLANQEPTRAPADMCGSLHLSGSPSSCVSHRPAWWGCDDSLRYGHFHGFGDTAEDLTEASGHLEYSGSVRAQQKYNQALISAAQLLHGS
ncbi:hypothetical protein LDENG_00148510 [Lucifuga dentata]|nr:hypothetical protein LDENG_00148510 [Lucifuga dentata]